MTVVNAELDYDFKFSIVETRITKGYGYLNKIWLGRPSTVRFVRLRQKLVVAHDFPYTSFEL